jgi:hypothetical protein
MHGRSRSRPHGPDDAAASRPPDRPSRRARAAWPCPAPAMKGTLTAWGRSGRRPHRGRRWRHSSARQTAWVSGPSSTFTGMVPELGRSPPARPAGRPPTSWPKGYGTGPGRPHLREPVRVDPDRPRIQEPGGVTVPVFPSQYVTPRPAGPAPGGGHRPGAADRRRDAVGDGPAARRLPCRSRRS